MVDLKSCRQLFEKLRTGSKNLWQKYRNTELCHGKLSQWLLTELRRVYQSWRTVLLCILTFLFFYYFLGSQLAENIDTKTEYQIPKEKTAQAQTVETMSFLIKREIDDKMWTPNLPILFPAYVLDNMPNFQIGITNAIRDMVGVWLKLEDLDTAQTEDLQKSFDMLGYAPDIWLLSKRGTFGIAPSSNTQYRKAAKYLSKFNDRADFKPQAQNLAMILAQMSRKISRIIQKSEDYQRENSNKLFDSKADDIFYHNRGYAFALWQISKALCIDFKDIIVGYGAYVDWTFLHSSLEQAAKFAPVAVRNGKTESLWTPNHLLVQNFYLIRAQAAVERIRTTLARGAYAD